MYSEKIEKILVIVIFFENEKNMVFCIFLCTPKKSKNNVGFQEREREREKNKRIFIEKY